KDLEQPIEPGRLNAGIGGCSAAAVAVLRASRPGRRTMPARSIAAARRENDAPDIAARIAALDWAALGQSLDAHGCAVTEPLLNAEECSALAGRYADDAAFRSRVIMARHGFGRGEYKY